MRLQVAFFKKLKAIHPDKKQLPKELMTLLNISSDSAYRRLRGETALSIDEAFNLSKHYELSFSEIENFRTNQVTFTRHPFINSLDNFEKYLRRTIDHLDQLLADPDHQLIYTAKDIPIFYPYKYEKLGAFKMFVWLRGFFDVTKYNDAPLSLQNFPSHFLELAKEQWKKYNQVNAVELWNDTTIFSLLNQIEYYFDAGLLQSKEEALELCDNMNDMLKDIYLQVSHGARIAEEGDTTNTSFKMYFNEVVIMDNNIISLANGRKMYSVPYGAVNYANTTDIDMCNEMHDYIMLQAKKSTLMNDVSEKERNQFFMRMRNRVDELKKRIESHNPFML